MGEWKFLVALLMPGRTLKSVGTVSTGVSAPSVVRAHGGSLFLRFAFILLLISAFT